MSDPTPRWHYRFDAYRRALALLRDGVALAESRDLSELETEGLVQRESARARLRVLVKRILRKHGYPSDLQDGAVQTVLVQAEALSIA